MKRLLLILVIGFGLSAVYAQNQIVRVVSNEGDNLSYSVVYVNGNAIGATSRNAEAVIPRGTLKVGDTISATYVGYEKANVIYEGFKKAGYELMLNMSEVEKVTVYSRKETRKEFRQIKHLAPVARACDYSFRFVMDKDGKEVCRGDFYHYFNASQGGIFSYNPKNTSTAHNRLYMELDERHVPMLEDADVVKELRYDVIPLLQEVFYTASRGVVTDLMFVNLTGTRIRKTAEKGRRNTFLLSRDANGRTFDQVVSSMVYVDVDTLSNNVVESRMTIVKPKGRLELVATYSLYEYFRYPNVIEATYYMKDGSEYAIDIYDTHIIKKKDKIHVFKKSNSVNIWDVDNDLLFGDSGTLRYDSMSSTSYSKQIYDGLYIEVTMSGGGIPDLLFRERLEMLSLANSVE